MTLVGSGTTSRAEISMQGLLPTLNINEQMISQDDLAVELPADVPEDVMRNAPVSTRNRLSYTLGLKPKDNADHRISSIYYPKALGALLKVPHSPDQSLSPLSPASRAVAVRSVTPHTESEGDYFSAQERSPSIGRVTPDLKQTLASQVNPCEGVVQRTTVRSPVLVQDSTQRQSSILSPGLTYHPSVMAMATPPAELPALTEPAMVETPPRPQSRSRQQSESSLGEPGPEIADVESDSDILRLEDIQISALQPKATPAPNTMPEEEPITQVARKPSPTMPKESEVHELATIQHVDASTPHAEAAPPDASYGEQDAPKGGEGSKKEQDPTKSEPPKPAEVLRENTQLESVESKRSNSDAVAQKNEETTKTIIAELEAIVPQAPSTKAPISPIELEAPLQHFRLPPRSAATAKTFGKDYGEHSREPVFAP